MVNNISLALKSETKATLDNLSFILKESKTNILDNAVKNYFLDLQAKAKELNIKGLDNKSIKNLKNKLLKDTLDKYNLIPELEDKLHAVLKLMIKDKDRNMTLELNRRKTQIMKNLKLLGVNSEVLWLKLKSENKKIPHASLR